MQVTMYPVPIIPEDWSPEQAIAVYEFLDKVRERIWDRYQEPIIEQFQINCDKEKDEGQLELFPFNDELPF
jgi:hypothetical protein